jgi:hypothetical protein
LRPFGATPRTPPQSGTEPATAGKYSQRPPMEGEAAAGGVDARAGGAMDGRQAGAEAAVATSSTRPSTAETVGQVRDLAGQILDQGVGTSLGTQNLEMGTIQQQDLGEALQQLMTVDMTTEAELNSTNMQEAMSFLLGAVRTIATEQQEAKSAAEAMQQQVAAAQADLAAAVASAAGGAAVSDEALAAMREQMEAAKSQQVGVAGQAVEVLQGQVRELQEIGRTQAGDLRALQDEVAQLRGLLSAAAAGEGGAAVAEAMAEAERASAAAAKQAREADEAERRALKDEMARVESELARLAAMQQAIQESGTGGGGATTIDPAELEAMRARAAETTTSGAVTAVEEKIGAQVRELEGANAQLRSAMEQMQAAAKAERAQMDAITERLAMMEALLKAGGGAADGGGGGGSAAALMAMSDSVTERLGGVAAELEGKASLDALEQLREELLDAMRAQEAQAQALAREEQCAVASCHGSKRARAPAQLDWLTASFACVHSGRGLMAASLQGEGGCRAQDERRCRCRRRGRGGRRWWRAAGGGGVGRGGAEGTDGCQTVVGAAGGGARGEG